MFFLIIGCTVAEVVRFADPYASWKEALKIPTVVRPNFPNYAIFAGFTDKKLTRRQKTINSKPERKLKFETPKAPFYKIIV